MNPGEERLCDDHEIVGLIASMARKLADARRVGVPLYLVGVRSRGVPLAQRLGSRAAPAARAGCRCRRRRHHALSRRPRAMVSAGPCCEARRSRSTSTAPRSCWWMTSSSRAGRFAPALNAICDLGRPACIRLAVLVDRGHREIPDPARRGGSDMSTTDLDDHVRVRLHPVDPVEEVVKIGAGRHGTHPSTRSAKP